MMPTPLDLKGTIRVATSGIHILGIPIEQSQYVTESC